MSMYVPTASTISQAWLATLDAVHHAGGRKVNVLTTVSEPEAEEDGGIRAAVDALLIPGHKQGTSIQSVDTVANTIFPASLYNDPGFAWSPDLAPNGAGRLDLAASDLFEAYGEMLPLLCTADGNHLGTYFGRMSTWPGKKAGGVNQLADRIKYLRLTRKGSSRTQNVADIAIGGEALAAVTDQPDVAEDAVYIDDIGLQTYAPTDRRLRGFPCLVHIDLTLLDGRLSMLAVYRHQYLITKAYGNLVGLSRLLSFLAQQTGFAVGELAVQATLADTERSTFGGKSGIDKILSTVRTTPAPLRLSQGVPA